MPNTEEPKVADGALASAIQDLADTVDGKKAEVKTEPKVEVKPESVVEVQVTEEKPAEPVAVHRSWTWLWIVAAFLGGLVLGLVLGFVLWGRTEEIIEDTGAQPAAIEEVKPTASPTSGATGPTPTMGKVDRGTIKVKVLNGTGGKGIAAAAQTFLQSLGYKNVAVGNADKEDYSKTEISVKKDKTDLFATLKADLGSKYTVSETMVMLEVVSEYDAIVTIGK